jgi:hypothetical protein
MSPLAGEPSREPLADGRQLARLLQRRFAHVFRPANPEFMSLIQEQGDYDWAALRARIEELAA